jgi:hypothetical protein
MKNLVAAIAVLLALGWSEMAFAQTTACPVSFTCAFSAAETMSSVTPKASGTAGQPDVYLGYLVFDASSNVTMTGVQNVNGAVGPISTGSTNPVACVQGLPGQPATITFSDNSQISFVTDSGGTELQFILSRDKNTDATKNTNSVRIGVCRQK